MRPRCPLWGRTARTAPLLGLAVICSWTATAQVPTTARGLYEVGCARCHGTGGAGADLSQLGFDAPLPDFADCSFAEREPDADWIAVAHQGGPVRAFDRSMPAFGEAFSEAQLALIIEHVRSFCTDKRWPRGELNLPRALVTEKAFPEDEAVWTVTADLEGPGRIHNEALYEKRFGPASMFEIAVPFGAAEASDSSGWAAAVGDVAVGLKHTLHHDVRAGTIVAVGGEIVLPTGDEDRGLGGEVARFEPYAAWGQLLGDVAFLQAQGGLELSADTEKAEHEAFWRLVMGGTWSHGRFGRSWSPMVEVLGAVDMAEGARVQWDLVPQVQVSLNTRQHVLLDVGVRIPLTSRELRSTRLMVYLLWDWFDGGLLDGW